MNIAGVKGLTEGEKGALKALGAVAENEPMHTRDKGNEVLSQ